MPVAAPGACVQAKLLQLYPTVCDTMVYSLPGSSVHGILQAKNTGVGSHSLLQGLFPTQGSNLRLLGLLHWQAGSLQLAPPSGWDLVGIKRMHACSGAETEAPTLWPPDTKSWLIKDPDAGKD